MWFNVLNKIEKEAQWLLFLLGWSNQVVCPIQTSQA